MNSGGTFLLAVIVFFFCLWLIGGGPHKSIYTQGIFITPITHEGDQQEGYGPQITLKRTVTLPGGGYITASTTNGAPNNSSLIGKVAIVRTTQSSSANPNQQFLEFILTSNAASPVNINGWKFISAATGDSAEIDNPSAMLVPKQPILIVSTFPSSDVHDTMQLIDANGNLVASVTY